MPPCAAGVFLQARCVYSESTETPMTSTPRLWNAASLSSKAMISVGQTKVKSSG